MSIGKRIAEARKRKGLSQEELAAAIGVSVGTLSRNELGKSQPRAERLEQLAEALDVTVGWLLTGESTTTSEPIDDDSIPFAERSLREYRYPEEKEAWIRERMPETVFSTGATPGTIAFTIEQLATQYELELGRKLPLPERDRVEEPSRLPPGALKRRRKPKR